jgi:hypothetical protein
MLNAIGTKTVDAGRQIGRNGVKARLHRLYRRSDRSGGPVIGLAVTLMADAAQQGVFPQTCCTPCSNSVLTMFAMEAALVWLRLRLL